ncbi:hypothetical protein [Azospirillum doebereinerae]
MLDCRPTGDQTFQSHAPAWGATPPHRSFAAHWPVSIHAPAWGATNAANSATQADQFQSTLPHGERPAPSLKPPSTSCFNPRSRMGSDGRRLLRVARRGEVSIHAPAWGATRRASTCTAAGTVSIHAPAWGATLPSSSGCGRIWRFNPRSRMGSDPRGRGRTGRTRRFQSTRPHGERPFRPHRRGDRRWFQSTLPHGERPAGHADHFPVVRVSIHAPAWGATSDRRPSRSDSESFNPRSRMGSDTVVFVGLSLVEVSIHAPAWGATWRDRDAQHSAPLGFNPRSRMGSDFDGGAVTAVVGMVSIHAPAWGATVSGPTTTWSQDVSIHAPAWGATVPGAAARLQAERFNPRSRMGSDPVL